MCFAITKAMFVLEGVQAFDDHIANLKCHTGTFCSQVQHRACRGMIAQTHACARTDRGPPQFKRHLALAKGTVSVAIVTDHALRIPA